jgi:hypothetical protein
MTIKLFRNFVKLVIVLDLGWFLAGIFLLKNLPPGRTKGGGVKIFSIQLFGGLSFGVLVRQFDWNLPPTASVSFALSDHPRDSVIFRIDWRALCCSSSGSGVE